LYVTLVCRKETRVQVQVRVQCFSSDRG
ncbi:uncharacterized, partial [Tachysurus ichikawai]